MPTVEQGSIDKIKIDSVLNVNYNVLIFVDSYYFFFPR